MPCDASSIRDEDNIVTRLKALKIRDGPPNAGEQRARVRGYSCPGDRRTSTRQNRTTVNGSSLQSSYFLMMAGPGRVHRNVHTRGPRIVGSLQENHEAEPQNRSVPYCSTSVGRALLFSTLQHYNIPVAARQSD